MSEQYDLFSRDLPKDSNTLRENNIVSFRKYEQQRSSQLPKIRTIRNRGLASKDDSSLRDVLSVSQQNLSSKFRHLNKNSDLPWWEQLRVKKGLTLNEDDSSFLGQLERHEKLFDGDQLKSSFVRFGQKKMFFNLTDQTELRQYLQVSNMSEVYHFKFMFFLSSKEFYLSPSELVLAPGESSQVEVIFRPLKKTMFHFERVDVIVTNEKIKEIVCFDETLQRRRRDTLDSPLQDCLLGGLE